MYDFTMKNRQITVNLLILWFPMCLAGPTDIEDILCPEAQIHYRKNASIFSELGESCSFENDAYILGSIFKSFTGEEFKTESLIERWTNMAYLDASPYDDFEPTLPGSPPSANSCIFNERLAKYKHSPTTNYVSTQCNAFNLTYCRIEYDSAQDMKTFCDCNDLYSIKSRGHGGVFKCYARAGVPCMFDVNITLVPDPFLQLPTSIECHSSLVCNEQMDDVKRNEVFKKSFHGYGINSIAYEFMITNATGYCACKDPNQQINEMNECVQGEASLKKAILAIPFSIIFVLSLDYN